MTSGSRARAKTPASEWIATRAGKFRLSTPASMSTCTSIVGGVNDQLAVPTSLKRQPTASIASHSASIIRTNRGADPPSPFQSHSG